MEDDTSSDTLDYDETKAAIPSLGFIDVVGYDGCNMASIEIMDLWHGHATAITGSQEYVGWDGLEYDVFLNQLKADPTMSADQLAINSSASTVTDKTWSAVAVDARMNTLMTAVDQWSVALKNGLAANKKAYTQRVRSNQVVLPGADGQGPLRPGDAGQCQGHRREHQGQGARR